MGYAQIDMLGLNFTEVLVILIVLLIVVGPEQLPHMIKKAGKAYGQVRRLSDEFRRALMLEVDREEAEQRAEQFRKRREEARRLAEEARKGITTDAPGGTPQSVPAATGVPSPPAAPGDPSPAGDARPNDHLADPDVALFLPEKEP